MARSRWRGVQRRTAILSHPVEKQHAAGPEKLARVALALKRPPGRPKVSGVLGSSRSLPRLRATGAARSPESTRVLAAVGATRQKYSRPRPVSGQYEPVLRPVLRGGGTAAYRGGIRPVPEHLTWYSKTK